MKKLIFALLLGVSLMSCDKEVVTPTTDDTINENTTEATIIGRWQLVGFDNVIRDEFTPTKRFRIYSNEGGVFPTLEEFMEENPGIPGNDWEYEGNTVVVDLNFGNYSRLVPNFKCDNNVIDWISEDGSVHSTYYREGHDISACN